MHVKFGLVPADQIAAIVIAKSRLACDRYGPPNSAHRLNMRYAVQFSCYDNNVS
jgi:hypothetical protein